MSPATFKEKKEQGRPISMVTCYDTWSAKILSETEIDILLVGDSLAMVVYGHDSTLPVEVSTMALHTEAVRRGASKKFIVADMPFMGIHKGIDVAMGNIECLMKKGANAVKVEGAFGNEEVIKRAIWAGVPIMGHLGLTPQSIHQFGGFKIQGKDSKGRNKVMEQAKLLEDLGCFALVLECVPSDLAREIALTLKIPIIGIGAGKDVDGQVLVLHDFLGMQKDFMPKFLRRYLNGYELILNSVSQLDQDIKTKKYPNDKESY